MANFTDSIQIDQIGYRPTDRNTFFVTGRGGSFAISNAANEVVLKGTLQGPIHDAASGDAVFRGDLSGLPTGGPYTIQVEGIGQSAPVFIRPSIYKDIKNGLLRFFYFQRCGIELPTALAGPWAHAACHTAHGIVHGSASDKRPSHGGWHDAGDYGKYIVAAAKAIADLLLAFELYPSAFAEELQIPESGNGVPDILNEVRFELEWFFRMQREDGAVYHKLTTKQFPGLSVMPEDDLADLVFSPVSYTATATFAAAMAMASRVYRSFDADFATQCLVAAETSWKWVASQNNPVEFRNPSDIHTGEYGDTSIMDEKYWAAAELYRTTQSPIYHDAFLSLLNHGQFSVTELGWASVGGYGTIAYLLTAANQTNRDVRQRLIAFWQTEADRLVTVSKSDGYGISLTPDDYIWGSTMVLLNQAMHLIFALRFTDATHQERPSYEEVALQNLHYLFGANPLGQSYVSGYGVKPLMNPHHRPSVGDNVDLPVPGMVSGGPNKNLQDPEAKRALEGQPPARCFIDHIDSYSTNEVTIYWNSPAVFVTAHFDKP